MEEKKIIQLKQGLTTAFINYSHASNLAYKPQFISNNYKEGRKVISSVEDELLNCEEFAISVAFITMGGYYAASSDITGVGISRGPGKDTHNRLSDIQ